MELGKISEQQCLAEISSGEVIISGPAEESAGKGAVIVPGEGVILRVNGEEVKDSCQVYPRDKVEVEALHLQEPARVAVKVAADKMAAEAVYLSPQEIRYTIPDHPPTSRLIITANKTEESAGSAADLSPGEIRNILQASGVVYGLDESALPGLLSEPGRWQVVARGRPLVQGRNGYVEFLFKEGLQQVSYDQNEAQVDYFRRYEIPQVEKGRVIARIHPPQPGEPGLMVTGEEVFPEPVYPAKIYCEYGAVISADQTEVVASSSGVPVYCRRGERVLMRVDSIYYHRGDVDIKSGHIDFKGHLKIEGGIKEGLRVKADRDIEIDGHAFGAEITAGGSIIFKNNCVKCQARAGWQALQVEEFSRLYDELTENFNLALNMGRELVGELQKRGSYSEAQINIMLRSLIQKKLPELPEQGEKALRLSRELARMLPEPLQAALQSCHRYLQGGGQLLTLAKLEQLSGLLEQNRERWSVAAPGDAAISVYYLQNSSLACPGDIYVHGTGAYNSFFNCGGQVHIKRIFRGGSIKAGGDIYIGEAGIPRLAKTQGLIETASRSRVYLGRVYENTRIKIGKAELCLKKDLSNIKLYRDQEGEIRIGHWDK